MLIILKLMWPYVLRYLMNRGAAYAASYLQLRRQGRLQHPVEPEEVLEAFFPQEAEIAPAPEIPVCLPPPPPRFLASDAFWYTLSGLFLGTAISIIVAYLVKSTSNSSSS